MKTRNIELTLEKAKEWYKKGGDLKEVALQAYNEEELKDPSFENIKTFEDACYTVGLHPYTEFKLTEPIKCVSKASAAAYRLNIIRKALNKGQKMDFTNGTIWCPYIPFITKNSTYYKSELDRGDMEVVAKFKVDCNEYLLLGGRADDGLAGLGSLYSDYGVGYSFADIGFLGCATKEIAQHMSKYFAKEIFEAMYGDTVNFEWI